MAIFLVWLCLLVASLLSLLFLFMSRSFTLYSSALSAILVSLRDFALSLSLSLSASAAGDALVALGAVYFYNLDDFRLWKNVVVP